MPLFLSSVVCQESKFFFLQSQNSSFGYFLMIFLLAYVLNVFCRWIFCCKTIICWKTFSSWKYLKSSVVRHRKRLVLKGKIKPTKRMIRFFDPWYFLYSFTFMPLCAIPVQSLALLIEFNFSTSLLFIYLSFLPFHYFFFCKYILHFSSCYILKWASNRSKSMGSEFIPGSCGNLLSRWCINNEVPQLHTTKSELLD